MGGSWKLVFYMWLWKGCPPENDLFLGLNWDGDERAERL